MYKLPNLPYDHSALEPHIDEKTMRIHHGKHHAGYVAKLNKALEGNDELLEMEIIDLLQDFDKVPDKIKTAVRNNGGGHANHSLFWTVMSPDGGGEPEGELLDAINSSFDDFSSFKKEFTEAALGRFGSGWAWLVVDNKSLSVTNTPNQDSPLLDGKTPILGLDVWEHAYYLNYQNKRGDYIDAWWNVVNWDEVAKRLKSS